MTTARQHSLARGVDVARALSEITAGSTGWVMAAGNLEALELKIEGKSRRIDGNSVIVSFSGPCGGPYVISLYRSGQMLAGELDNARSLGMTVIVMLAEKVERPAVAPAPEKADWAANALATAAETRAAEPDESDAFPKAGDLVQHFAFGLCEVLTGDEDCLKIRDLHGKGRIREIRLEVLNVTGPANRDGKRLFRLERRN